jgi:type IV pilus assembly protein PilX
MNHYLKSMHLAAPRRRQRGIALFVVLVIGMLSMLLALWASRTSMFNELIVGNDADYQRAYEAAEALLVDAELDIRGTRADGLACTPNPSDTNICRGSAVGYAQIPLEATEVDPLLARLESEPTFCRNGLCAKRSGRQDFWNYTASTSPAPTDLQAGEVSLNAMEVAGVGARYGQYTGAALGASGTTPINPILMDRSANDRGGWYWVEVLKYSDSQGSALMTSDDNSVTNLSLNLKPNVVYRITALAYGRRSNTVVVLQETFVRQIAKD